MKKTLSLLLVTYSLITFAAPKRNNEKLSYKTYFGSCPSQVAGKLTLTLMKEFEKKQSLLDIKQKIITHKLAEKYFLSDYKVDYDPLLNKIRFEYECPKALMKVQIYKDNGDEFYTAILVETGKLYDPTYEVLLRGEKKLKGKLPHLALPVKTLGTSVQKDITQLISELAPEFRRKISEVIIDEKDDLTIILSVNGRPSSVFLGKNYWSKKVGKLVKVIDYMKKKKSIPAVINLTNSKKIVVKFSDTL